MTVSPGVGRGRLCPCRSNGSRFLWTSHRSLWHSHVVIPQRSQTNRLMEPKLDLLQGTLDLMVLRTLATMGPLHGYGIARRIEQISGDAVILNQGTIYASLVRLQQRGWIRSAWGTSENNRRARFYSLTAAGRKRLADETTTWERLSAVVARILTAPAPGGKK